MQKNNLTYFILILLLSPVSQAGAKTMAASYKEVLALCNEIAFPNAQARPEGFNIDAHLKDLEAKKHKLSQEFQSKKAVQFLRKKLATEKDDTNRSCIKSLMAENAPSAQSSK